VTPADFQKFGINWSLRLTNEGGYIVALIAGLMIANFLPRRRLAKRGNPSRALYQDRYRDPRRLPGRDDRGASQSRDIAVLRGIAAIIEAYLITGPWSFCRENGWLQPEWAPPPGISICGVSAAIATGAAIRSGRLCPRVFLGCDLCGRRGFDSAGSGARYIWTNHINVRKGDTARGANLVPWLGVIHKRSKWQQNHHGQNQ
jgi:hypothetical protein